MKYFVWRKNLFLIKISRGFLIKVVGTDVSFITPQKANSAGFVDTILPNKKYYYIFRCIDIHNHISNPTSLFEVEMVNENGTIFLLVNIIDFEDKIKKQTTKTMRRFVQLVPTLMQGLIDEDKSGFSLVKTAKDVKNNVVLSLSKEKLWGKKFKIRISSKVSGKKIEFDVLFKHNKVEVHKIE